jgi:hypothetical protein
MENTSRRINNFYKLLLTYMSILVNHKEESGMGIYHIFMIVTRYTFLINRWQSAFPLSCLPFQCCRMWHSA